MCIITLIFINYKIFGKKIFWGIFVGSTLSTPMAAKEVAKDTAIGGGVAAISVLAVQGAVSASLPTIMSVTGTVVAGVGTIHAPIVAVCASFAAASFVLPAAAVGCVIGLGFAGYKIFTTLAPDQDCSPDVDSGMRGDEKN